MNAIPLPDIATPRPRRWITRELADSITGKKPDPYLRLHDPALASFVRFCTDAECASSLVKPYFERFIHFWREASIFDLPRTGPGQDETLLFLFEAAFDLARSEPEWAAEMLEENQDQDSRCLLVALHACVLGHQVTHESLLEAFARLNATHREQESRWSQADYVMFVGRIFFLSAVGAAHELENNDPLAGFRRELTALSLNGWGDRRAFAQILRGAPHTAPKTSRGRLFEHPLLRVIRSFYLEDGLEAEAVMECLGTQCLAFGIESEDDSVVSELTLAAFVRNARSWASHLRREAPKRVAGVFREITLARCRKERAYLRRVLGENPSNVDDIDATRLLLSDEQRTRGHELSRHRGELLEITASVLDSAIWLGWLFPNRQRVCNAEEGL